MTSRAEELATIAMESINKITTTIIKDSRGEKNTVEIPLYRPQIIKDKTIPELIRIFQIIKYESLGNCYCAPDTIANKMTTSELRRMMYFIIKQVTTVCNSIINDLEKIRSYNNDDANTYDGDIVLELERLRTENNDLRNKLDIIRGAI